MLERLRTYWLVHLPFARTRAFVHAETHIIACASAVDRAIACVCACAHASVNAFTYNCLERGPVCSRGALENSVLGVTAIVTAMECCAGCGERIDRTLCGRIDVCGICISREIIKYVTHSQCCVEIELRRIVCCSYVSREKLCE